MSQVSASETGGSGIGGGLRDAGIGTGGAFGSGGAVGSGGSLAAFSWSSGGQSFSNAGYYQEDTTADALSLTILISSDYAQLQIPCWLRGQFPMVPPPSGTYPIADGTHPQIDGTFVGGCSTTAREATVYADPSVSGMVTLAQSAPGIVEGTFTMRSRPNGSFAIGTGRSPGSMIDFAGSFSVGCERNLPLSDPSCAVRSISSP